MLIHTFALFAFFLCILFAQDCSSDPLVSLSLLNKKRHLFVVPRAAYNRAIDNFRVLLLLFSVADAQELFSIHFVRLESRISIDILRQESFNRLLLLLSQLSQTVVGRVVVQQQWRLWARPDLGGQLVPRPKLNAMWVGYLLFASHFRYDCLVYYGGGVELLPMSSLQNVIPRIFIEVWFARHWEMDIF